MDEEDPPNSKRVSKLENMVKIKVEKHPEPILSPDDEKFDGKYSSIRNPGGVKCNGEIILLPTVRHTSDNKSRLHIARSLDGYNFTLEEDPFIDINPNSLMGVEDARITKTGDKYYIAFTEFKETDGKTYNTTRIGLVETRDFKTYTNRIIILDEYGNNKNGVIIPNEEGYFISHRPFDGEKPSARIAFTKNFNDFEDLGVYFSPRKGMWDNARVGLNTPPVPIGQGKALALYHGATIRKNIYRLGGLIVDEKNPRKILARSEKPLIKPEFKWETSGNGNGIEVPNVVFTCNLIYLEDDEYITYHSGVDKYLGFTKLKVIHI